MAPRQLKRSRPAVVPFTGSLDLFRRKMTEEFGSRIAVPELARVNESVSTGSVGLDLALVTGGWVRGRIHEIAGQEGSGKTSVAICSMREQQRLFSSPACYIDMEQTFDYDWAESLGLDTSKNMFFHSFPQNSEDVADILRRHAESGKFPIVVVDSIGGMESKKAIEKDAEDPLPGRNAQVITRMVKMAATIARVNNVTILLINQMRANIGGYGGDVSAGPMIIRYATTTKVQMSRTSELPLKVKFEGFGEQEVGRQMRARVMRSKIIPQGRVAEFWILNQPTGMHGPVGINTADEILVAGKDHKIITLSGSRHDIPGIEGSPNGALAARRALWEHPEVMAAIRQQIMEISAAEEAPDASGPGQDGKEA